MIPQLPPPEFLNDNNTLFKWLNSVRTTAVYGAKIQPVVELENTDQIQILSEHHDQIVRIKGKSATIILASNPQITKGYDGQKITIEGSDDTNSVQLVDGNGLQLNGGNDVVLENGDIIKLHFNEERNIWIENYRSINRP